MRIDEFPAQDFISSCNEANENSDVFHWVIGALKRDQSESLDSFQNILENLQTDLTEGLKGQLKKFSDCMESFLMAWKVSRWPGKVPVGLESFQMTWKVSR